MKALGQLWLARVEVDWSGFYAHERRYRLPLPTYPFERKRYWIEPNSAKKLKPLRESDLQEILNNSKEYPTSIDIEETNLNKCSFVESLDAPTNIEDKNEEQISKPALEEIIAQQTEIMYQQLNLLETYR